MTRPAAQRPFTSTMWFTSAFSFVGIAVAIAIAVSLSSCSSADFGGDSKAPAQPTPDGKDARQEDSAATGGTGTGAAGASDAAAAGTLGNPGAGGSQGTNVPLTDALAECSSKGGNWTGSQCVACGGGAQWDASIKQCVFGDGIDANGGTTGQPGSGPQITADQIQQVIPLLTTFMNNIPAGGSGDGPGCGC